MQVNDEKYETGEEEKEDDITPIPEYRAFNLYVMLTCGLIMSLTGICLKLFSLDKEPSLYFDGERFQFGAIDGIYYIVTGLVICIFPAWQLYKGNHKVKGKAQK